MQKKNIRHLEHKLIITGSAAILVFLVVFVEWKSSLGAAISMAVFGTGQYLTFASGNICIFLVAQHRSEKLMIIINAFFGVGALLVPQIMRLLQTNVYYLVFLSFLISSSLGWRVFYDTMVTPEISGLLNANSLQGMMDSGKRKSK